MPHGLTVDRASEIMEKAPLWVRPLAEQGKSKKPLRVIRIEGNYARLEVMEAGHKRQMRVALEKLEPTPPPAGANPPAKPKSAPPPPPKHNIPASALAMFPVLRAEVEGTPMVAESAPEKAPEPVPMAPRPSSKKATYVVYESASKKFYTDKHQWTWDLGEAREYDVQGGANKSAGRLMGKNGKSKGKVVVVLRYDVALEMWCALRKDGDITPTPDEAAPEAENEPELVVADEPAAAAPPKPVEPPKPATVAIQPLRIVTPPAAPTMTRVEIKPADQTPMPATMSGEFILMQRALEDAMRDEFETYCLLQDRKKETARIRHEIDVHITRKKNAYR